MTENQNTPLIGQDLARAVVAAVEAHPEMHDQRFIWCGTQACLAGWAIALHIGANVDESIRDTPGFKSIMYDDFGYREADEVAWKLLELDDIEEFRHEVFGTTDRREAIANFKRLTGIES